MKSSISSFDLATHVLLISEAYPLKGLFSYSKDIILRLDHSFCSYIKIWALFVNKIPKFLLKLHTHPKLKDHEVPEIANFRVVWKQLPKYFVKGNKFDKANAPFLIFLELLHSFSLSYPLFRSTSVTFFLPPSWQSLSFQYPIVFITSSAPQLYPFSPEFMLSYSLYSLHLPLSSQFCSQISFLTTNSYLY